MVRYCIICVPVKFHDSKLTKVCLTDHPGTYRPPAIHHTPQLWYVPYNTILRSLDNVMNSHAEWLTTCLPTKRWIHFYLSIPTPSLNPSNFEQKQLSQDGEWGDVAVGIGAITGRKSLDQLNPMKSSPAMPHQQNSGLSCFASKTI